MSEKTKKTLYIISGVLFCVIFVGVLYAMIFGGLLDSIEDIHPVISFITYCVICGSPIIICFFMAFRKIKSNLQSHSDILNSIGCENEVARRRYSLDNQNLCFMSVFYKQNEVESISFDVEAANDYHYQIYADQLPKLCEYLQCPNDEEYIAVALTTQLKTWKDPIEIAKLCRNAGVKYQVNYWY